MPEGVATEAGQGRIKIAISELKRDERMLQKNSSIRFTTLFSKIYGIFCLTTLQVRV